MWSIDQSIERFRVGSQPLKMACTRRPASKTELQCMVIAQYTFCELKVEKRFQLFCFLLNTMSCLQRLGTLPLWHNIADIYFSKTDTLLWYLLGWAQKLVLKKMCLQEVQLKIGCDKEDMPIVNWLDYKLTSWGRGTVWFLMKVYMYKILYVLVNHI